MAKNSYKVLIVSAALSLIGLAFQPVYGINEQFKRNGEVYMSVSSKALPTSKMGIFRLNNPAEDGKIKSGSSNSFGFQNGLPSDVSLGKKPQKLLETITLNFAVDLNRVIYALVSQDGNYSGPGATIFRQVLDGDSESNADYGTGNYIHADHRGSGQTSKPVYRTTYSGGTRYPNSNKSGGWTAFVCLQGDMCPGGNLPTGISATDELPDDPGFGGSSRVVPIAGKNWYEIPNGSWWSSWNHNARNSSSYYVYRDVVSGTFIDWNLAVSSPNSNQISYSSSSDSKRLARTSSKSISRNVLAGCLDSCGVNGGSGSGKTPDLMSSVAFMPTGTGTNVRTYVYQRHVGMGDGALSIEGGGGSSKVVGNLNGYKTNDTRFVGVSKSSDPNNDYIYLMGTSVIRNWISKFNYTVRNDSGVNYGISAVAVSNQWDEEGGIVFALDPNEKRVYKMKFNGNDISDQDFEVINLDELLSKIGADKASKLDDIGADGFGNLYLALTYPTKSDSYIVPKELKYDVSKATAIADISRVKPGDRPDETTINFEYKVKYRKDVWRVSAIGQNPTALSNGIEVGEKTYTQKITFNTSDEANLPTFSTGSLSSSAARELEKGLSKLSSVVRDNFIPKSSGAVAVPDMDAKISVINTPTPPEMYDLGGKKSYLDIIGAYTEPITPKYDALNKTTDLESHESSRVDPFNLNVGQTYFFYVENYPISVIATDTTDFSNCTNQDPNTNPDIDGDTQVGGFISSTIGKDVEFDWKIWRISEFFSPANKVEKGKLVKDKNNQKVVPCYYSRDINEEEKLDKNGVPYIEYSEGDYSYEPEVAVESKDNSHYVTLHSPVAGKYIITCKAKFSYYDFDLVQPGQTKTEAMSNPNIKKTDQYAVPSKPLGKYIDCDNISSYRSVKKHYETSGEIEKCLYKAVDKLFVSSDYENPSDIETAKSKIKNYLWNELRKAGNEQYVAIMAVDVPGVNGTNESKKGVNIAALQRAVVKPNPGTSGKWSDVSGGYFCSSSAQPTYWRIELDKQAVFFTDNMDQNIGGKTVRDILIERLLDKNDVNIYGDSKSLLLQRDSVKWKDGSKVKPNSMKISFYTTEGNTKKVVETSKGISVKSYGHGTEGCNDKNEYKDGGNRFMFVEIPANYIHPTDPYIATVTFEISRDIEYQFKVVEDRDATTLKYMMGEKTITIRRPISLIGEINLMTVDTTVPRFEGGAVTNTAGFDKQINGTTGKILSGKISFDYKDNSPFEKLEKIDTSIPAYRKAEEGNLAFNQSHIAAKDYLTDEKVNFRPVFDAKHRKIELTLNLNGKKVSKVDNGGKYTISVAPETVGYNGQTSLKSDDYTNNVAVEENVMAKNFGESTISIKEYDVTNIYDKVLPLNYANNLTGYKPSTFDVCLTDSSGNVATYPMDLVLEVVDDVLPVPFAYIQEKKNNKSTIFPKITNVSDSEAVIIPSENEYSMKNKSLTNMKYAIERDKEEAETEITANYDSVWDFTSAENRYYHMNLYFSALPSIDAKGNIKSIKNEFLAGSTSKLSELIKRKNLPPVIDAIEGVDIIIKSYGVDNCGTSTTSLTYQFYDVIGNQKTYNSKTVNTATSDTEQEVNALTNRVVYRKCGEGGEEFPYAAPISLTCYDNARKHDKYNVYVSSKADGAAKTIDYKVEKVGDSSPNTRTIKTFIPVIGSELDIRTIEKKTRY